MTDKRDRSIEALLRERRQEDDDLTMTAGCVDAEVLAAWMDGSLSGRALADAERHAAGCARCQALLASMAKTAPDVDRRQWWQTVTAKWLVPAAAIATALLIWVAVDQRREEVADRRSQSVPTVADNRQVPAEPIARPQYPPRLAPDTADRPGTRAQEPKQAAAADAAAQKPAPSVPERDNELRSKRLDALDKTADATSPRASSDRAKVAAAQPAVPAPSSTLSSPAAQTAAGPPPSAAAAPPAPATIAQRREQQPVTSGAGQSSTRATGPPDNLGVAESVTVTSEAAGKALAGGVGGGRTGLAAADIRSPQSDYRWRIVPPSGIRRSVDGGVTWSVVDPVPVPARGVAGGLSSVDVVSPIALTAGSSPSRDVCWIVGRAGMVLLTTDGATWQRRPIPEAADLTAVRAADAKSATVTTLDGRQFATSDAGLTWTALRHEPDVERD